MPVYFIVQKIVYSKYLVILKDCVWGSYLTTYGTEIFGDFLVWTVVGIGYLSTMPGILKALELLFDFIGLICIVAVGLGVKGTAFLVGTVFGLIWTGILLIFYVLNIISKMHLPWFGMELIAGAVLALYLIIVSAVCIATLSAGYIAGGVFGLLAAIAYGADAFHKYSNM